MNEKVAANYELAEVDYMNGMKYKEIAEKYHVTINTVKSWKTRYQWSKDGKKCAHKNEKSVHTKKEKNTTQENNISDQVAVICEDSDLSDKQRLFCCLYVKCFNATKAYQKAYGCSYETALVAGSRLLGNVRIKEEIQKLKQNRLNREMLSAEDIFQKYMDIAFADITDYVEFGREEVPVMTAFGPLVVKDEDTGEKHEVKKEVNVVRFKESFTVDGTIISEVKQGRDGASIKLADKMKALQWLSDHMDMATEEQKIKMEHLKLQTERIKNMNGNKDDGVVIINDAPEETS